MNHPISMAMNPATNLLHDSDGGAMAAPTVALLPLNRIHPDPEQPRRDIETAGPQWEGLVASVREHGVLQPILVRRHPEDAKAYMIIRGERRWRAARAAGHTHIMARLARSPAVVERKAEIQLLENGLRDGLSPLDESEACLRLLNATGMEKRELARLLGVSPPVVSDIIKLDRIHPEVRIRVRSSSKTLPRRQLLRIARLSGPDAQLDMLSRILDQARAGAAPPAKTRTIYGRGYCCDLRLDPTAESIRLAIRGGSHPGQVADALRRLADELSPADAEQRTTAKEGESHAA